MNRIERLRELVNEQAEDEGLWFIADHLPEAYLQQELRKLHSAIEPLVPELLSLVERLSEVDPWYDKAEGYCVGCGTDLSDHPTLTHKPDCPFLLLEQWKADE